MFRLRSRSLFFKLFAAFFLVVAVAFAVETWQAILAGRGAIETLVTESLTGQAEDVLDDVNRYLEDRCREVKSWAGLSIMDEVLVQDRFLNIENLLLELQRGRPRQYGALAVLDRSGTVIAATDVDRIGGHGPLDEAALHAHPGTGVSMGGFPAAGAAAARQFMIAAPVVSRLHSDPIGWLVATVSWGPLEDIVTGAMLGGSAQDNGRFFLLAGPDGAVLAGHPEFVDELPDSIAAAGRVVLHGGSPGALRAASGYLVTETGAIPDPGAPAQGLHLVALWRTSEAFQVVRIFVVAVLSSAVLGLALAAGAAFAIARSITARLGVLIEGTGRLARGDRAHRVEEGHDDEFGKLARAFNAMASELAHVLEEQEASLAHWRALVTHAPDIIMTVNGRGTILFINRVITGFRVEQVVGTSAFDYVAPAYHEAFRRALERVFERGEAASLDLEGIGPEGRPAWYATRIGPVERDGQVVAVTVITTDITHRKRLEREIVEVSELERERIGRDLHDGLGQVLTGTALLSKGLQQKLADKDLREADDAERIKTLIGEAIEQTRVLARGLVPIDLDKEGLRGALEALADNVERLFGVACRVEGGVRTTDLDRARATHLFRIAQEAVSNSLRHGKAQRITIRLGREGDENSLTIADDGTGFPRQPPDGDTMGLRSMRYRAGAIGGVLEIAAPPEGGTVVACRFHGEGGETG